MIFAPEESINLNPADPAKNWKVLVVDDEEVY